MAKKKSKQKSGRMIVIHLPLAIIDQRTGSPHLNDIGGLIRSMELHGFVDPPRWSAEVNDGNGGVADGNGRLQALTIMQKQGHLPPDGIGLIKSTDEHNGDWAVPIQVGEGLRDALMIQMYAIDTNNLVLSGAGFTPFFIAQTYDEEMYATHLQELIEQGAQPVTVASEQLEQMADALLKKTPTKEKKPKTNARIRFGEFSIEVPQSAFEAWWEDFTDNIGEDKEDWVAELRKRIGLQNSPTPNAPSPDEGLDEEAADSAEQMEQRK